MRIEVSQPFPMLLPYHTSNKKSTQMPIYEVFVVAVNHLFKNPVEVDKDVDFLGYTLHPKRKLRASPQALNRFIARFRRLYEQKASSLELWQYVVRWTNWLWGGLYNLSTSKGGRKRYFYLAVRCNRLMGIYHPYRATLYTEIHH